MAALALLGTLGVNLFTLAQVARAVTTVPWADQWVIVRDSEKIARGEPLWPILWTPYWGHRLVIPRLLFLADARWFSFASLTWLTLLLQFVHIAMLIALARLLLRGRSPVLFTIAITAILNLMLSPFQMENFVWGMQTMFPLVFVASTAAFLCLSLCSVQNYRPFVLFCVVLAMIASYTMPNGLLVWPVLVAQGIYLRQNRNLVLAIAALGTAVIASYLWHYTRPLEMGMGAGGVLRHPADAVMLIGLMLGSPFRLDAWAGVAVGLVALFLTGYIFTRALLSRSDGRRWLSSLFAVVLFVFLSSLSIVAGRLTPKDLPSLSIDFLPGRYFTMICLFWTGIALLALATSQGPRLRALVLCVYGVVFICLMFTSVVRQLTEAEDWADFFLGADAVGSAMLVDVPDEQLLSVLWLSRPEREQWTEYLREHRLALFHEPRASWLGKRVSELFLSPQHQCAGAIEKTLAIDGSSWRVSGRAWDADASSSPDDILFTDPADRVIGLARGGLRHGYFPGFLVELQGTQPPHSRLRRSEWLGYVRLGSGLQWTQVRLYGLFRGKGKVCNIRP